jgi:hypothetical protein
MEMMWTVSKKQVGMHDGKLTAFASDLNLNPGVWPDFIAVLDGQNEGYLFHRVAMVNEVELECGGYKYATKDGAVQMTVWND